MSWLQLSFLMGYFLQTLAKVCKKLSGLGTSPFTPPKSELLDLYNQPLLTFYHLTVEYVGLIATSVGTFTRK